MPECALSIIIPQYKEKFNFMRPLFTSIDTQRLIDFGTIEVIIVNDCGDQLDKEDFETYEHLRPRLIKLPINGGVGVARQKGMDEAKGAFITFIDADDALYSPHSLFKILAAINSKPDTDLFHGQFMEEQIIEMQYGLYLHDKDITFCHGKVYRKAFLTEKNVRCHPTLRYNEDSFFNALVYAEAEKIEYIDFPLICWTCNPDSTVRAGGMYRFKHLPDYIQSMSDLCEELIKRKKPQVKTTFLQALHYIYLQMQDEAWELGKVKQMRDPAIKAAAEFFKRHEALYDCGNTERLNFLSDCRRNYATPVLERQTFGQFLAELKNYIN